MQFDWKRSFKLELEERQVFALDIGSSAVKVVQMRKYNGGYVVTAAGITEIAPSEDDKSQREINTTRAIRECFKSAGIRTRMAVCGVSGPEVAIRYFKFPSLPTEEIEGAVLLEAAQVCPFDVNDGAIEYQLVPDGENNICGVLVAATNHLIKNKTQTAKDASLDCVLMDVDGLALLNWLGEYEKSQAGGTTAILNVGSSFTTLAIMSNNALPFIRDMSYAGNDILAQVAADNNASPESIREILRKESQGLCGDPKSSHSELHDSLEKASSKLILDVSETLRYYATQAESAVVEKIFVCGGFALVKGFVEILNNQLPATTVLWNPFDKTGCEGDRLCKDTLAKNGPAMAVAAGLAMRSI